MSKTILHIDASARTEGSVTRDLTAQIVAKLDGTVTYRDLARPLPLLDNEWVNANFTPAADRSEAQAELLSFSDSLVAELKAADTIVIGAPIYNFSVPAVLKAWIDLVARAGVTFQYSEAGYAGLLEGKRAIVAIASGGTQAGSDVDFATGYLKHVLGFIGITDVEIIAADTLAIDADAALSKAHSAIAELAA